MIIDIDRESRQGYAKYLVNRPDDAYTILEGNPDLFDTYANKLLIKNQNNPDFKPYYRMLLSFEEEDLTLPQLTEIYEDFKKDFFKNYDQDEYNLFSVIHWDDNKPHIHIGVISNNLINGKALKIMRGYHDIPRVDAIAEKINYEYDLKSAKDSVSLFPLTPSQKVRDWKVKKGREFYPVDDDKIYSFIKEQINLSNNFDEFLSNIKRRFPDIALASREFENVQDGKFKEEILSIKIHGKQHSFKSFLYNKGWFEKNLNSLKNIADIEQFRASIKRNSYDYYVQQFERMSKNHRDELNKRKIHEGLLEHKLKNNQILFKNKNILSNLDFSNLTAERVSLLNELDASNRKQRDSFIDTFLEITKNANTLDEIKLILSLTNYRYYDSFKINDDHLFILKSIDEKEQINIVDENLFNISLVSTDDLLNMPSPNKMDIYDIVNFSPSKREELKKIKTILLEYVLTDKDKGYAYIKEELKQIGIEVLKTGYDSKKGNYVSLKYKQKQFNIYSDSFSNFFYPHNMEKTDKIYKSRNDLLYSMLSSAKHNTVKSESVTEYRLSVSDFVGCNITAKKTGKYISLLSDKDYSVNQFNRDRNIKYLLKKYKNFITLEKLTELDVFINDLLNDLFNKKVDQLFMHGDYYFEEKVIDRLKELSLTPNFQKKIEKLEIDSSVYKNPIKISNGKIQRYSSDSKKAIIADASENIPETLQNQNTKLKERIKIIQDVNQRMSEITTYEKDKSAMKDLLGLAADLSEHTKDYKYFFDILKILDLEYSIDREIITFLNKNGHIKINNKNEIINKIIKQQLKNEGVKKVNFDENFYNLKDKKSFEYSIYTKKLNLLKFLNSKNKKIMTQVNLDYFIQDSKPVSPIIYSQKESEIIDFGNKIKVVKAKDIGKSMKYVIAILNKNNRRIDELKTKAEALELLSDINKIDFGEFNEQKIK